MQQSATDDERANQERSRLIDHFKRAYQIIVGLAITLACTRLFSSASFSSSIWFFCTFFITVVPIFHGGDRSLDIKYLGAQPTGFWGRAAFIWDVYVLLITAILFVKIALSIPTTTVTPVASVTGAWSAAGDSTPESFYLWMGGMLTFDVAVLAFDRFKTARLATEDVEESCGHIGNG